MKSFLAVLAMVVVLMAGMAGMASATTLTFDVGDPSVSLGQSPETPYIIPAGSPIASVSMMNWHDDGGGHLYCSNSVYDNIITFTDPTYVNSFQITGLPWQSFDPSRSAPYPDDPNFVLFGPVTMSAFSGNNPVPVWSTTVDFGAEANSDYTTPYIYLTVDVNAADVTKIIFYGSNPSFNEEGPAVYPSIDNLVINEAAAVPIPGSVWLLVSGLLGLVGLRRKLTCQGRVPGVSD